MLELLRIVLLGAAIVLTVVGAVTWRSGGKLLVPTGVALSILQSPLFLAENLSLRYGAIAVFVVAVSMVVVSVPGVVWKGMKLALASGAIALCALTGANAFGLPRAGTDALNLIFFVSFLVCIGALVGTLIRIRPWKSSPAPLDK
jgi:hypothetical protein